MNPGNFRSLDLFSGIQKILTKLKFYTTKQILKNQDLQILNPYKSSSLKIRFVNSFRKNKNPQNPQFVSIRRDSSTNSANLLIFNSWNFSILKTCIPFFLYNSISVSSLSLSHSLSLSPLLSLFHSLSLSLSLLLFIIMKKIHFSLFFSLPFSLSFTHSLSFSLSHTHTLTISIFSPVK